MFSRRKYLADTSSLVDGRILSLFKVGLFDRPIVVPEFVLDEVQQLADSDNAIVRRKGKRALQILKTLKEMGGVEVTSWDSSDKEVDVKLIIVAKKKKCTIITTDAILSDRASLKDVKILNINSVAYAVSSKVLVGDEITLRVVKAGREDGQGIGYLKSGTMVVVDGGGAYIGQPVKVRVGNIISTAAGMMIFSKVI